MGLLLDPVLRFRNDLAESSAVREVLEIEPSGDTPTDIAAALERIYIDGLPEPPDGQDSFSAEQMQSFRPYILIYPDESDAVKIRLGAMTRCIDTSGTVIALVSLPYTSSDAKDGPTEIFKAIATKVDKLLYNRDPNNPGIVDYLGQAERLQARELDVVMFGRTPLANRVEWGDAYDVLITCRWGVE